MHFLLKKSKTIGPQKGQDQSKHAPKGIITFILLIGAHLPSQHARIHTPLPSPCAQILVCKDFFSRF